MKIGIVTINYNQADFLREAIDSVKVSEPGKLQYVIVDPGSTDNSAEIIEEYRKKGKFYKCLLEPDKGAADGLNKGIQACDAEIMGCLNADDRYLPGALDYVLEFFEQHPEVDVLTGMGNIIDSKGKARYKKAVSIPFTLQNYLIHCGSVLQQATFYRKKAWEKAGGFNIENKTCWDGEILVDMALTGARFKRVFVPLGEFRIHDQSISGTGRLEELFFSDRERIDQKIIDAGIERPSILKSHSIRYFTKLNPEKLFYQFVPDFLYARKIK